MKYHRDRDFLVKYNWRRTISSKTNRAVYTHNTGKWPEQPSVKGVRRAMRAFFDGRREERRAREANSAAKRQRANTEKAEKAEKAAARERAKASFPAPSTDAGNTAGVHVPGVILFASSAASPAAPGKRMPVLAWRREAVSEAVAMAQAAVAAVTIATTAGESADAQGSKEVDGSHNWEWRNLV